MRFAIPDYQGSRNRLLWVADDATPQAKVDAILVPTRRPVRHLEEAARAARTLDCPLVTLHSPGMTSASQADAYFDRSLDLIAIDMPGPAQLRLPTLETSRLLAGTIFERRTDVSTKRNLALVLSHMLRWKRVVFLDDDIRVPDPADLRRAASLLDTHTAVGLTIGGFPDNSVVCHAYRDAGGRQDTFISGRALAVDVKRNRTFFPNIYNEDWFFVLDAGKRLQPVATVGQVLQDPYNPYRPERARAEEFGEVLAEGTFWLLDQDRAASDGDLAHWREFLTKRKRFIRQVLGMVESATTIEPEERAQRAEALNAALGRLARITPELCVGYHKALVVDQERWQRHVQAIRRQPKLRREQALESLASTGGKPLTWYTRNSTSLGRRRTAPRIRPARARELQSPIPPPPAALVPRVTKAAKVHPTSAPDIAGAVQAEADADRALARHSFDEAVKFLETAVALDPGRDKRLRPDLDCLSRQPNDSSDQLAWRRGLWLALADGSPFQARDSKLLKVADEYRPPTSTSRSTPSTSKQDRNTPDSPKKVAYSPERIGSELETAFIRLLQRFFHLAAEDERVILQRLRKQRAGTQFGHDVQFDCTVAGNTTVRCHVECKNYGTDLQTKDVSDKILQMQTYWRAKKIDYFIIVTPRAGVRNDLDRLIQDLNHAESMPFQIQVWGPEEKVEELFALEPEAYKKIYRTEPPTIDTEAVIDRWLGRLKPMLRLPASLSAYLTNAAAHCMPGEDEAHFQELFGEPIEVEAASSDGVRLGLLRDELDDWAHDPAKRRLLLVGEFGDGKSFAGYQLTRRLAKEYEANPAGYFALRLPLRDLRTAGDPQGLLSRRLETLGANVSDWFSLDRARTVVVLDGVDEMSAQLDHDTVVENLRMLADCVHYFSTSKLLVTSRTHFFETSRQQETFLEQLEDPNVVRLAPVPRNKRSDHLEKYAERHNLSDKFKRIRHLYDPIDLAAKPLFLQMIKETLPALPDDHFDEIVLYETSVRESLTRKAELLRDKRMRTLRKETFQGMIQLLESLAIALLDNGGQPINLRTFDADNLGIAQVLWKMSEVDAGAQQSQDARARLGVRSLLKPHPKSSKGQEWPVTFCHRSMSEYFIAQAIVRALRNDYSKALDLLSSVTLGHEVIRFITLLVNKGDDDDVAEVGNTLNELAHDATKRTNSGYLGGNAITLAFRIRWQAPRDGWTGLNLDYADLSGADLARVEFKGSSLRYATLDNADLSYADLTDCDLTGVRIEETAPVIHIAPGRKEDTVLACYGDGSIREWSLSGVRPVSETLLNGITGLKAVAWSQYGDLILLEGPKLSLWKITKGQPAKQNEFQIRNGVDYVGLAHGTVSFTQGDGDQLIAVLADCQTAVQIAGVQLTTRGPVIFAGDETAAIPMDKNVVRVIRLNSGEIEQVDISAADFTALDMRCSESGEIRLVLVDTKGCVTSLRTASDRNELKLSAESPLKLHEGPVLATTFLSEHTVATGGADRSLIVCDWDDGQLRIASQLKLSLRCVGIKTAGVQGDRERQALEALRRKAEDSDRQSSSVPGS